MAKKCYKANITLYMRADSPEEFNAELQEMFDAYYYDNKTVENSEDAHEPWSRTEKIEEIPEEEFEFPNVLIR